VLFEFLFDSKKLKSLNDNELQKYCANVHSTFSHGDLSYVDLDDFFFSKLKVLKI